MPALTTIGGASLRSFGRGIEQVPAVLPAHTVLLYNVTNSTTQGIPTGWQLDTTGNVADKYLMGTFVQSEIGTYTTTTVGTANAYYTSATAGDHIGSSTFTAPPYQGSSGGQTTYSSTVGGHQHSGYSSSSLVSCKANTVAMTVLFGDGTSTKSKIPPNTIVWRKIAPTSLNFTSFGLSGSGYIYAHNGKANTAFTDHTTQNTAVVTSVASAGNHNHQTYPSTSIAGTYSGSGYNYQTAGAHTDHSFTHPVSIYLKSKALAAWSSPIEEDVEYGMIVMYYGDLTKLPAGWRVCNGQLGTPNMSSYYIPIRSGTTHDSVVESTSGARVETPVAVTGTASVSTHSHSGGYAGIGGHNARHSNWTWNHTHSFTVQSMTAGTTTYAPPTYKLAFIQYKGI